MGDNNYFMDHFGAAIIRMTGASEGTIEDFLHDCQIKGLEDEIKEKAEIHDIDLTKIYRWAPYRWFYYALTRLTRPKTVVETGVWYGTSTSYILKALQVNDHGVLHSIDLPNAPYTREDGTKVVDSVGEPQNTGLLVPPDLRERWNLIVGNAIDQLPPLLGGLNGIDMFIHDGEHTYDSMMFEFREAFRHLRIGGILLSDDVHYNDSFRDFVDQVNCEHFTIQRREGHGELMGAIIKS